MGITSCSVFFSGGVRGEGISLEISESEMTFRSNKELVVGQRYDLIIKPMGEAFDLSAVATVTNVAREQVYQNYPFIVSVNFVHGLKDFGKLVSEKENLAQKNSLYINAPADKCFEAICDFDNYCKWVKFLISAQKKGLNAKRPQLVSLTFNFYLKKLEVLNRYSYDESDCTMSWEMRHGDLASMTGKWHFEQKDPSKTLATFEISLTLGFYAPKKGLDYLKMKVMYDTMIAFKKYVESLP